MAIAAVGQFADAYTTNKNIAKGFKESNTFFIIQWLSKHPHWNLIVKAISGTVPGIIGFLMPRISSDISTIKSIQAGLIIGTAFLAEEGFRAAYHNYKIGKV